ncbi:MAG: 50S ribosomal protein L6, partial [Thermoguttaceae bacterium]|nr:50S ribosomal protein L6 [Thermoguttaceae bacterium]
MSRIGKKPVVVPNGVSVEIKNDRELTVKGPKGELSQTFRPEVGLRYDEEAKELLVDRLFETRVANAMHGLTR